MYPSPPRPRERAEINSPVAEIDTIKTKTMRIFKKSLFILLIKELSPSGKLKVFTFILRPHTIPPLDMEDEEKSGVRISKCKNIPGKARNGAGRAQRDEIGEIARSQVSCLSSMDEYLNLLILLSWIKSWRSDEPSAK